MDRLTPTAITWAAIGILTLMLLIALGISAASENYAELCRLRTRNPAGVKAVLFVNGHHLNGIYIRLPQSQWESCRRINWRGR